MQKDKSFDFPQFESESNASQIVFSFPYKLFFACNYLIINNNFHLDQGVPCRHMEDRNKANSLEK